MTSDGISVLVLVVPADVDVGSPVDVVVVEVVVTAFGGVLGTAVVVAVDGAVSVDIVGSVLDGAVETTVAVVAVEDVEVLPVDEVDD